MLGVIQEFSVCFNNPIKSQLSHFYVNYIFDSQILWVMVKHCFTLLCISVLCMCMRFFIQLILKGVTQEILLKPFYYWDLLMQYQLTAQ